MRQCQSAVGLKFPTLLVGRVERLGQYALLQVKLVTDCTSCQEWLKPITVLQLVWGLINVQEKKGCPTNKLFKKGLRQMILLILIIQLPMLQNY